MFANRSLITGGGNRFTLGVMLNVILRLCNQVIDTVKDCNLLTINVIVTKIIGTASEYESARSWNLEVTSFNLFAVFINQRF